MDKKMTYEEAMKRLENICMKFESAEMEIETMADKMKEAKGLAEFCKTKLTIVEEEVKKCLDM